MNAAYDKFNRAYVLILTGPQIPIPIIVTLPFTLEFEIHRDNYSTTNRGTIRIYNLSKLHRQQIVHDQFVDSETGPSQIYAVLQAGYGKGPNYPVILKGNASRAFSYRQGVDFITQLDVFDGGLAYSNAISSFSVPSGTSINAIRDRLIRDLTSVAAYGLSVGALSNFLGTIAKGQGYSGSTIDLLTELSNSNFFIDNGLVNVLLPFDAIGGNNVIINSTSGLLGTPIKEQQWLQLKLLFEPRLTIGSLINLDSIGLDGVSSGGYYYNGPHKVASIAHRGVISLAVSGEAVTEVGMLSGTFNTVNPKTKIPATP